MDSNSIKDDVFERLENVQLTDAVENAFHVPSSATTILYLPQGATALTTLAGRMAAVQVVSLNRDAHLTGDSHGIAGA